MSISHESRPTIAYERGSTPPLVKNTRNMIIAGLIDIIVLTSSVVTTGCREGNSSVGPNPEVIEKKPEFETCKSSITAQKGDKIEIINNGTEVQVGGTTVFKVKGGKIESLKIVSNTGKETQIFDSYVLEKTGNRTLTAKAVNNVGYIEKSCSVKIEEIKGPEVKVVENKINAFGGVAAKIENNSLKVGEIDVAVRPEDCSVSCEILDDSGQPIGSIRPGENVLLPENGKKIELTVINKEGGETTETINIVNEAIYGLETYNPDLEAGKKTNLGDGLTLADGVEITEVKVVYKDGSEIVTGLSFIPQVPGLVKIEFKVKTKYGGEGTVVISLEVAPLQWTEVEIPDVKPEDILPILKDLTARQREKNQDLISKWEKIARAVAFRDILQKGEYENIYAYMLQENTTGGGVNNDPGNIAHAKREKQYLTLLHGSEHIVEFDDYPKFKETMKHVFEEAKKHPERIFLCALTRNINVDDDVYKSRDLEEIVEMFQGVNNVILLVSGGTVETQNGVKICYVYNGKYPLDNPAAKRNMSSMAPSDKDSNKPPIFTIVGINENKNSLFPIGYHPEFLFGGIPFPYYTNQNKVELIGNNATSDLTYCQLSELWLALEIIEKIHPNLTLEELVNLIRNVGCYRPTINIGDENGDEKQQELYGIDAGKVVRHAADDLLPEVINVSLNDAGEDGIIPVNLPPNIAHRIIINGIKGMVFRDKTGRCIALNGNYINISDIKELGNLDDLEIGIDTKLLAQTGINAEDLPKLEGKICFINNDRKKVEGQGISLQFVP